MIWHDQFAESGVGGSGQLAIEDSDSQLRRSEPKGLHLKRILDISWRQVPHGMKQFAESRGIAGQWECELELVRRADKTPGENAGGAMGPADVPAKWPLALLNRPAYGPPMWPGPMAHSPANELGVVFLFGAMAERMGFVVHRLQAEFPDCEAIRQVGEDKWQKVRIEFEYESRNFLKHMHAASECDLIVCWKDNWPECPLEVVELRREIARIAGIAKKWQLKSENLLPLISTDEH